ncbi:MAG: MoxR family ATPase [Candidatus Nanohaloarchaeota archaeon QJJ-5]|nr:MoxR family ATPase [Candidatus Nanohaloarchaeota archaeon QJJ-5]
MSSNVSATCQSILDSVSDAVIADQEFLDIVMTGLAAKGHVLVEDVPGTGKTLTARSFARALGLSFNRIQFTPDLLPSDITGSHIYNEQDGSFEFSQGPIFANVVLADEINRAPPKTQAALLEAMGEKQVTVDNETWQLPEPFFVIATQNPVEQEGTFALPEAQRDRFMIKTAMGYPDRAGERTIIDRRADRTEQMPEATKVVSAEEVLEIQEAVEEIEVQGSIRDYIIDIGRGTRIDDRVEVGVSPRGIQRLFEASRAYAMLAGREFVIPEDVKAIATDVLHHRLVLTAEAAVNDVEKETVIEETIGGLEVPEV